MLSGAIEFDVSSGQGVLFAMIRTGLRTQIVKIIHFLLKLRWQNTGFTLIAIAKQKIPG